MLIKIYAKHEIMECVPPSFEEKLHILDNVTDVTVHKGNFVQPFNPVDRHTENYGAHSGQLVRIIDYTKNGENRRALIKDFAYVCNDQGRTIEKVEISSEPIARIL